MLFIVVSSTRIGVEYKVASLGPIQIFKWLTIVLLVGGTEATLTLTPFLKL